MRCDAIRPASYLCRAINRRDDADSVTVRYLGNFVFSALIIIDFEDVVGNGYQVFSIFAGYCLHLWVHFVGYLNDNIVFLK